ncbi:hypothetical protein MUK42_18650 [Musa troglodytarum]|uniref:Uncharacterized protein n=1 Tax=Musa troglodytarum TaxID=320322 RepID=A0A9E7EP82_9LILI|nr:hypothetical protein MUK42_18650 [Musa troglodytarum]
MANNCRGRSNLQSFLDSTTPSVPSHKLPKSCCRAVQEPLTGKDKDSVEFFILGDLWKQYYEWSAYGASVPVRLHNGATVIQYYVPYLSGVQIYPHKATAASRENSGNKSSSDSEYKKLAGLDAASQGFDLGRENEWRTSEHARHLYFEFFESCSPYGRIPLVDKVLDLEYGALTCELDVGSLVSYLSYPNHTKCEGAVRMLLNLSLIVFFVSRYSRHDKRSKLPGWILSHLHDAHLNLSTDMALHIAREFLRRMAQPYDKAGSGGKKTLLTQEDIERMSGDAMEMF